MYKSSSCSISIPILGILRDFYFNCFHGNVVISHVVLILISLVINRASQVALVVKNLSANAGDGREPRFSPWVGKVPWRRKWQPTPVFLPGESHGQRRLDGWIDWACLHVINDVDHLFMLLTITHLPLVMCQYKSCPFFSLSCLAARALRVIYIFCILVLYQLCVLKIFYVILWLDFSFSW